jgi:hypothetical protein
MSAAHTISCSFTTPLVAFIVCAAIWQLLKQLWSDPLCSSISLPCSSVGVSSAALSERMQGKVCKGAQRRGAGR